MSFYIDKQTLDDLGIFSKKGKDSVYSLFNRTHTRGGAEQLEQLFRYPLSDAGTINHRSRLIQYFQQHQTTFPFQGEWFDAVTHYLSNNDERSKLSHDDNKLGRTFNSLLGTDTEYKQIAKGVSSVISIVRAFQQFLESQPENDNPYLEEMKAIKPLLQQPDIQQVLQESAKSKANYEQVAAHDQLLRFKNKDLLHKLLYHAYNLDVYLSVAGVASSKKFVFANALPSAEQRLELQGVYHPLLENAIGNTLQADGNSNIIFLTGANMAGKSTFMKSLGIAVYLAHVGFPIAANAMTFPVMDGLFSTINLPDNLSMGYSHFYAEVLRVKKVAETLAQGKKIFVLFDELFRGTNVKDAYEATVALTAAFAGRRDSMFVISTHIIEAGDVLAAKCDNIQFVYLPTRMENNHPIYTYTLEKGITEDRHGMIIINNEKIIDILKHKKQSKIPSTQTH